MSIGKHDINKAAAMARDTARLACGDVLQTVNLFRLEYRNRVTIEQVVRVSEYDRDEINAAVNYLITAEYLTDATKRLDHGDKRVMDAVGITKAGSDLVLRTTDDPGVIFRGDDS